MNERPAGTRAALLGLRQRLAIAKRGAAILRGKRAALADEFFRTMRGVAEGRRKLDERLSEAARALTISRGQDGPERLEGLALSAGREIPVEVTRHNVWGVPTPTVKPVKVVRIPTARGTDPARWSLSAAETARLHEEAVELLVSIASRELLARRLGDEIRETSRRINALEQELIPKVAAAERTVRLALDQREQEDLVRRRRLRANR